MNTSLRQTLARSCARDVMHAPIVACDPATDLRDVAAEMARHRIHAVVVDGISHDRPGDRLVWAVLSDLDLVRAAVDLAIGATAGEVAATPAVCVDDTDDLVVVAATLVENECSHAVVTADERPVGVVSTLDVVAALAAAERTAA
ncbi:CBS domain-containing protein [Patulibacter defluvii]|uniref:CBS domain-containing protein n=1 Tax=Patulibacter defluvii TaxID=3095358 RepID=UPI002A7474F7|nr:CBS domain-containing protein [Patulibacter sp. DM4]